MSSQVLELVFYGELVDGADLQDCKSKLGQLFQASPAQIEKMFSGQRVVLKSKVDETTAKKYQQALKARGAVCKLEPMNVPQAGTAPEPSSAPEQTVAQVSSNEASQTAEASASEASGQQASFGARDAAAQPVSSQQVTSSSASSQPPASATGLPIAGEKVDEVLAGIDLTVDPVGVTLSEDEGVVVAPVLTEQDKLSIAPVGVDLGEEKPKAEPVVPDTSHLSLKD